MSSWDLVFDIESNNLLNQETIDYTKIPYRLKDTFKMHCIVVDLLVGDKTYVYAFYDGETILLDGRKYETEVEGNVYVLENYEPQTYIHKQLDEFPLFVEAMPEGSRVTGHNIINFDLLALKLYFGMSYEVEKGKDINEALGDDTWCGKKVVFDDTLIRSKTLNPDRFGGHSLDVLAQKGSVQKFVFRKHLPRDQRFLHFAPDMLYYNIFDTKSNREVAKLLDKEQQAFGWNDKWNKAIKLEKAVSELITRQEHRGFHFDVKLAQENLAELDQKMEERRERIEAILPPKPATKTYLKDFIPPATQFLKSGKPNSHITRFVEKHGGNLSESNGEWAANILGKEYKLPIAQEPICDSLVPSSVGDTTHIKDWLVGLGWKPLEYKEKDITVDTKKVKLNKERQAAAIERYIAQTLEVSFRQDRCEHLLGLGEITTKSSESYVRNKMLNAFNKRLERGMGIKVLTNPSFTVGQEKEMCPNLLKFAEENKEYACILDIVEYLTYRHRRNSILGGGVSFEDFEEDDEQTAKGFLGNVREDGRIPTPADTCGAATSRFKHRLVANIPRTTSLFGENMRAMFGVDDTCFQVGYDFDSLEARQEAAFCWPYEHGSEKEYCNSLLQDKPNDVHCYDETTEILTPQGWLRFGDLGKEDTVAQWEDGVLTFVQPQEIVWQEYTGTMVQIKNSKTDQLLTPNHRVLRRGGHKKNRWMICRADELALKSNQHAIKVSGKYDGFAERSYEWYELIVATQADGYLAKDCSSITFSFTKLRKRSRLLELLEATGIQYSLREHERKGRIEYSIRLSSGEGTTWIRQQLGGNKVLPDMVGLPINYKERLISSIGVWDGTVRSNGDIVLDTTCKQTRDSVTLLAITSGYKTSNNSYVKVTTFGTVEVHRTYISRNSDCSIFTRKDISEVHYSGMIGCVAVPSGLVLVRRNGCVFVSGNTKMSEKISQIIGADFGRAPAKSVKYGATYGAQGAKIAKTIGCDVATGNLIFEGFWEAAAPLKKLKDALQVEWGKFEKKRIVGIDGRLVPTRSAHAILNSKFQSGGVICAKLAMVIHDRSLREEGLLLDFFSDAIGEEDFCQQLIAYHK